MHRVSTTAAIISTLTTRSRNLNPQKKRSVSHPGTLIQLNQDQSHVLIFSCHHLTYGKVFNQQPPLNGEALMNTTENKHLVNNLPR